MKLTAIFTAAALATCALSGPALADPAPAPTSSDAAERLQLAHQLFDLSGGEKAVDQRIDALMGLSSKLIAANSPPDAAKLTIAMQHDVEQELLKAVPALMDVGVRAYADNLTVQELRDYVAWLSTPSGQSLIRKSAAIHQQTLDAEAPLLSRMLPEMERKVSLRVCEEFHCTAAQRKIVAQVMAKTFAPQNS
ncbi:MAG TPA: DUF2059 domain-containing protein [Caulobacteraceae bacterium]|jgi:hypothetical protein